VGRGEVINPTFHLREGRVVERRVLGGSQSASNETARQINRNILFNFIRLQQPISRAGLARISGLQRSTVSLIVEDLIARQWVLEGPIARIPRGRSPKLLRLDNRRTVLALDLQPRQSILAVADLAGTILAQETVAIPTDPVWAMHSIIHGIRSIIKEHGQKSLDGIGICLPERVHPKIEHTILASGLYSPDCRLKACIAKATGLRVEMESVARACALAEVWFNTGDRMRDLVVVHVAEGLEAGIFANGQLVRGKTGMAGNFGHVPLSLDGPLCRCGNYGCWDVLASTAAALRFYAEATGTVRNPTFEGLLKSAESGERAAGDALERMCVNLGRGLHMIMSALAPHEIAVVEDITAAWGYYSSIIEAEMRKCSSGKCPILHPIFSRDTARLRGALATALNAGAV
jgi:predicted NBD/HSP70 family sugar kinase